MEAQLVTMRPVVEVVERRLGLRCGGARASIMEEIIRGGMRQAGIRDPEAYARHLERDAAAVDALAEALRVPETYFLREPAQLRLIAEELLPSLAADRGEQPLRIWSAGCATGEEAYTLAIVSEEIGLLGRVRILGTDRSQTAIAAAKHGVYGSRSLRSVVAAERARWFTTDAQDAAVAVVADQLRHATTFRTHDLVAESYPASQDLIVCRNVLLYLTRDHGAAVVERLAESLAPGGWLLLGSADPHHHASSLLEQVRGSAGSLYRRSDGTQRRPAGQQERPREPRRWPARRPAVSRRPLPRREAVPTATANEESIPELYRCERDLAESPLDAQLHARHAMLLLEAGQAVRARHAATAAIFLDSELAAAHLLLGRAHLALQEPSNAARAFRNARSLLVQLPAQTPVAPTGTSAGRLLEVIDAAQRHTERQDAL